MVAPRKCRPTRVCSQNASCEYTATILTAAARRAWPSGSAQPHVAAATTTAANHPNADSHAAASRRGRSSERAAAASGRDAAASLPIARRACGRDEAC